MKLKYVLIFSILMLILTFTSVSASDNVTDEIAVVDDVDVVDNPVSGNTFGDIQKSVNSAKSNDVIELNGTYTSSGSAIKVTKNLVFDGGANGATLDAKGKSGIFKTASDCKVTLKNINFINAKGGVVCDNDGLWPSGGNLIIENCNFTDCLCNNVVMLKASQCSVINSNFAGNNATGDYGCIISSDKCTLTNCSFTKNSAQEKNIILSFDTIIDGCDFSENSARSDAVIYGGDIVVSNSNFTANSGKTGIIYSSWADVTVKNSRFVNNTGNYAGVFNLDDAKTVKIDGCVFFNNSAKKGGCIYSVSEMAFGKDDVHTSISISNTNITNSPGCEAIDTLFANLYLNNVNVTSLGSFNEICHDLGDFKSVNSSYSKIKDIRVHKAKLSAKKMTTFYNSYDDFAIVMDDLELGGRVMYAHVKAKVYTGKKYKEYELSLYYDDIPVAALSVDKHFSVGKHKIVITSASKFYDAEKITSYLIVKKAKTVVKAPAVKAKYKKSKKFKVTVKNKFDDAVSKVKIKIKVYTGKKYKTFTVKTNKKGVASINTKSLKRGVHKVKITSANKNYSISKKSKITIK